MALYLGLDIGRTAVKCVSVRTAYRKVRLESLALVELSEFEGDVTLAVQAVFARLFAGRPVHHDGIAVALTGDSVSQKTVHLPLTAQKQIAEVLPLQLADEIPFEIEDAVWDYRIPPARTGAGPATDVEVHAVVARVDDVRTRIDFVKGALAHEPERVGVGAYPLGNLPPYCPALGTAVGAPDEVVALLDLGMTQSDLLLLAGAEVVFSRTLSLGTEGLPGTAAKLARELKTSFAAHRAQGGQNPSRLVLAGGGAFVSGAEVFLASQLGLATAVLAPPDIELDSPAGKKDQGPDARLLQVQHELSRFARYAKALGLALGHTSRAVDYDLRRGPLAYERGFGWLQARLPQLLAFGVVLGIAVFVSAAIRLVALSRERTVLEEALGTVTQEVLGESTTDPDHAAELLAGQTESADPDPLPHADAFDVLSMLSKNIPASITHDLEEVDVNKGKVTVHGIVGSVSEAQDILSNLKSERCVAAPKVSGTSTVVNSTRQKYVLEFEIRCPEDVKKDPKKKSAAAPTGSAGE